MRTLVLGLLAMTFVGCGGGSGPRPGNAPAPARGSSNLITETELAAGPYQNALEAIQALRPSMLIPRGTGMGPVPVVAYMDDVRLNDLNGLATIPANRIREIRFVNARDATTRWGTGHASGAILVTTKR